LSRRASLGCLVALLGVGILGLGCGQDGSQQGNPAAPNSLGTGTGEVLVTVLLPTTTASKSDAPAGLDCRSRLRDSGIAQLLLTFDSIRLYPRSDSLPLGPHPRPDSLPPGPRPDSLPPGHPIGPCCPADSASFIEILTSPVTVDAMQLADTLSALLTSATVPAGNYSHLALRIPSASAVTDSGLTVPVVPMCPDSLLRVLSHFSVVDGQAVEIQFRVDLDRSVREVPPGSGNYFLLPVFSGEMHTPGRGHRGGPGGPGGPGGRGPGGRGPR
jgi:hypothetical protein